jgi:hypothetical protein
LVSDGERNSALVKSHASASLSFLFGLFFRGVTMQPNFFLSLGSLQLMHEPQPRDGLPAGILQYGQMQEIK